MLSFIFIVARVILANIVLRFEARKICRKLEIKAPKIVLGSSADKNKLGNARPGRIFVNISVRSLDLWRRTIRHELRHAWQDVHHEDIVKWCISKPEYRKYGDFYQYCPIELDARYYAGKNGDIYRTPIDFVSVKNLEEMYQNGIFIQQMKELSDFFGVPEQ
mgnify:FL=1